MAQAKIIVTLDVLFIITTVILSSNNLSLESSDKNIKMAKSVWIDWTNTCTCELLIEFFTSELDIHKILKLKKRTQKGK